VDFLVVSMTEKITAELNIILVGEPEAVEAGEGILLQGANSVQIECLPGDLIPSLEVDVSGLEINSAIHVVDLQVPDGVTLLSDPQEMIAQVIHEQEPEELEEEEDLLMMEPSPEVEVISRVGDEGDEAPE
jgi:large subunit ribosomal protein L25